MHPYMYIISHVYVDLQLHADKLHLEKFDYPVFTGRIRQPYPGNLLGNMVKILKFMGLK